MCVLVVFLIILLLCALIFVFPNPRIGMFVLVFTILIMYTFILCWFVLLFVWFLYFPMVLF